MTKADTSSAPGCERAAKVDKLRRTVSAVLHEWQASYDPRWTANPLYIRYTRDNPGPTFDYPRMDLRCRPRTGR